MSKEVEAAEESAVTWAALLVRIEGLIAYVGTVPELESYIHSETWDDLGPWKERWADLSPDDLTALLQLVMYGRLPDNAIQAAKIWFRLSSAGYMATLLQPAGLFPIPAGVLNSVLWDILTKWWDAIGASDQWFKLFLIGRASIPASAPMNN